MALGNPDGSQAGSNTPGNLAAVRELVSHPAFNITNPNNCYSLFLAFARSPVNFHAGESARAGSQCCALLLGGFSLLCSALLLHPRRPVCSGAALYLGMGDCSRRDTRWRELRGRPQAGQGAPAT
jgi:hypothetical protein